MNLRVRRLLVASGVIGSLIVGAASVEVAANLAATAAPPPAPPVSLERLQSDLASERDRSANLQDQLTELLAVTDGLTAALASTEDQVAVDGLTAEQLRDRLREAEDRLAKVTGLLGAAQARLAQLNAAIGAARGQDAGAGAHSGGGAAASPSPKPPTAAFNLSVSLSAGGVELTWTACSVSGFAGYGVVRSTDREIHYPPEDRDTLVATVTSRATLSIVDAAPSGSLTYRVYCLVRRDDETKVSSASAARDIVVP